MKLYKGKVVSLDDPDKKGRIQIQVLPELSDIPSSDSPWCMPMFGQQINNIAINDILWCLIGDSWQTNEMYYMPKYFVNGLIDFTDVTDILNNVTDSGTNTYKDLKFTLYPDGSLIYFNMNSGEKGLIQKDNSYFVWDKDGNVFIKSIGKIKIYNSVSLKDILKDLQDVVKNMLTPLSWIDGSGKPVTYTNAISDLTKINTVLTNINTLLSD